MLCLGGENWAVSQGRSRPATHVLSPANPVKIRPTIPRSGGESGGGMCDALAPPVLHSPEE